MRDIYYVQEQIGFAYLVEGTFERFDKLGREFANEPHGIAEQERQVLNHDLADSGVERSKEFVFGKDFAFANHVH